MRKSAMHIQLYSTTFHIIWHWINGISSLILVLIVFLGTKVIGIWSIPIGYIISFGLIYMLLTMRYSFRYLGVRITEFERINAIFPMALLLYIAISVW